MKKLWLPIFIALGVMAFIVAMAAAIYFYSQSVRAQNLLQNPTEAAKEENKKLIEKVGKLILLPEEDASIATIADIDKLKDQAFFAKAKKGDKVLVFTNAKKAILYDPLANKILEVAPLTIGSASASPSAPIRLVLYNGTTIVGLTQSVEKDIREKIGQVDVVSRENAKKRDYTKTIVVDLTGNNKDMVQTMAKVAKGSVGSLPEGELKPQADVLIIIGTEYAKK